MARADLQSEREGEESGEGEEVVEEKWEETGDVRSAATVKRK